MDDPHKPRNAIEKAAQKYFTKSARDDMLSTKSISKKERSAGTAKIARLRAMRLAKEAEDKDKEEADRLVSLETGTVTTVKRKRLPSVKLPKMRRMSY